MATLLVDGFIREFQQILIIPQTINTICLEFYDSKTIIFLSITYDSADTENWELYAANIDNGFNAQIKYNNTKEQHKKTSPLIWESVLYHTDNLKYIPSNINTSINSLNHKINFNAIFKIGGPCCNAKKNQNFMLIFNYNARNPIINSFKINLPMIPSNEEITGHNIIYSNKYGLLCIGGYNDNENYENKIYQLLFNNDNYDIKNWKWNELNKMNKKRYQASSIIIDNNKLMITGGQSLKYILDSVEIYDLNQKTFIKNIANMKYKRKSSAICYDNYSNNIYVGGGFTGLTSMDIVATNHVEYYNYIKNKWYKLPDLNFVHPFGSFMFFNGNNLLHLVSSQRIVEYIDLRLDNKRWCKGRHLSSIFSVVNFPAADADVNYSQWVF